MGYNNSDSVLVVMTNKDVYYVTRMDAVNIEHNIDNGKKMYRATDIKSGSKLWLQLANISSIVEEVSKNG